MSTTPIQLSQLEPFSKGGNRLCFVSPDDPNICLKVHQPERTPKLRRQRKSFPANLRPLVFFDENLQEHRSLQRHHNACPDAICRHLPATSGIVDTDLGNAHAMGLVRDENGLISQTIELYLWENGMDSRLTRALNAFRRDWMTAPPRSRDLLPHNLVLQLSADDSVIIIIDGYGRAPKSSFFGYASQRQTERRFSKLDARLKEVERRKQENNPKERLQNLNRHL